MCLHCIFIDIYIHKLSVNKCYHRNCSDTLSNLSLLKGLTARNYAWPNKDVKIKPVAGQLSQIEKNCAHCKEKNPFHTDSFYFSLKLSGEKN